MVQGIDPTIAIDKMADAEFDFVAFDILRPESGALTDGRAFSGCTVPATGTTLRNVRICSEICR